MRRNPILESIADPSKNFLAFLFIGIFGLGILSGGISNLLLETLAEWLQNKYGLNKILFQVGVLSLIGIAILGSIYFTNLSSRIRRILGVSDIKVAQVIELKETFIGLIAIPSLGKPGQMTPAEIAIRHHWRQGRGKLRYCWLLCTADAMDSTQSFLSQLQQECHEKAIPFTVYRDDTISLPSLATIELSLHIRIIPIEAGFIHDPNHIRELINHIYENAEQSTGLTAPELIADYTGGTKSMTAGMTLACTEPNRQLEYLVSQYGPDRQIVSSQLMKVMLSYRIRPVQMT